jgi:hypothetical protein
MWKEMLVARAARRLVTGGLGSVAAGVATLLRRRRPRSPSEPGCRGHRPAVGSSGEVWTMTGGAPGRLVPGTNEVTTYSPVGWTGVLAVDGAGKVWSPDSFSTAPGTVHVVSRLIRQHWTSIAAGRHT